MTADLRIAAMVWNAVVMQAVGQPGKRPSLLRIVEPLCRMLEVRVESVASLNTLDPARDSLARMSTQ